MRTYVDLHLTPKSHQEANKMILLAGEMGYRCVATTNVEYNMQNSCDVKVASRVDVGVRKSSQLFEVLKKIRRSNDLVAVMCQSKEAARQAAKDCRVDILLFPREPLHRRDVWLDSHEAELAEGAGSAYEVNVSDLITGGALRISKLLIIMRKEIENASKHDIPVILSSDAHSAFEMREPKALTALASLLDIDEKYALEMISTIPIKVLDMNKSKNGKRRRAENAGQGN